MKYFKGLTKFERGLWLISLVIVTASLIGVTALIFIAKGYVLGQILTVVFAVFYGIISVMFKYYGEMITYLFMTTPMAIVSAVEWYKNPYLNSKEVRVSSVTKRQITIMLLLTAVVTVIFYFVLKALDTANLIISTISITTSFLASYLTYLRSPYYALAYGANDIVLIALWILASIKDTSYIPMIFCFVMFLFNDIYGFVSWQKMKTRQRG